MINVLHGDWITGLDGSSGCNVKKFEDVSDLLQADVSISFLLRVLWYRWKVGLGLNMNNHNEILQE